MLDRTEDLIFTNPHEAVAVFKKIFQESSPGKNLKVWLKAAGRLNSAYFHTSELSEVPNILAQTLEKAASANEPELYVHLLIQQHSYSYSKGDFAQARTALEKAAEQARLSGVVTLQAMVHIYEARDLHRNGRADEALALLHQTIVSLKSEPQNTRYYVILNNLASLLNDFNGQKPTESLKIFAEITEYFDRRKLHFLASISYENYANILVNSDDLQAAVRSFKKAVHHAEAIHDEYGLASATRGLGSVFQKQQLYKEAIDQYQAARPIFVKFDDRPGLSSLDTSTARCLLALGKSEEAWRWAKPWKSHFEKQSPESFAVFTKLEAEILEHRGQHQESMKAYKRLAEIQQNAFDSKKQELVNRYYTEFEVERRNQENLKLEHENRLQSITIDTQNKLSQRTRLALAGAIVALAVLAFSFHRAQLSRRKIEGLQRYIETNVLQRFLPPELVQEILTGKSRLDDRTKTETVTVLFADLCQFTRATDRLGPETISHILNDFFIHMSEVIFSERGTIDKFIGDAIMVIFGAPSSLPAKEQALAAVRCAHKMQAKLRELNRVWELSEGQHFEMRIGIHQGQAVVGTFGGSKRSDYTVVGTTVNIAARVENIADPDSILVTDAITHFLPSRDFTLRGHYRLRGLDLEVPLFRIMQSSATDTNVEQAS
jgi:class 3 adenylate cyclase